MAQLTEWAKGITFFIFATLLYYYFWDNIFSNIINFLGTDIFGIGSEGTTSIAIMKTMAWISFVFLYLSTSGAYLIYTIIIGTQNNLKTNPLELLKAIGIWTIIMPFLTFIYGLIHFLTYNLNTANILNATDQATASQFSWILAIIMLLAMIGIPFLYILKGYGADIIGTNE